MPLERCTENGKPGYRWGKTGTCYTGKTGKAKALRQGRAIEASKASAPKKKAAAKKKATKKAAKKKA